ncbi:hypothetical protein ACLOJK_026583 [Asimina triloba]
MDKIQELEADFGDLVGFVSDLKEFQVTESTRLKQASGAEERQLKEKISCLEEAERTRGMKLDLLIRIQVMHSVNVTGYKLMLQVNVTGYRLMLQVNVSAECVTTMLVSNMLNVYSNVTGYLNASVTG